MAGMTDELHATGERTPDAELVAGTHADVALIGGGVAGLRVALSTAPLVASPAVGSATT